MIEDILGGLVILFVGLLVVGSLTDHVKLRACCSLADPDHDLRMRQQQGN